MAIIANLSATAAGYAGRLKTLTTDAEIFVNRLPAPKAKDNLPDYEVVINGAKMGAAWEKVGYLSLNIDDPLFASGFVALKKSGEGYIITWDRPRSKKKD
jgi:uncharacterized protein (DUF736 family)